MRDWFRSETAQVVYGSMIGQLLAYAVLWWSGWLHVFAALLLGVIPVYPQHWGGAAAALGTYLAVQIAPPVATGLVILWVQRHWGVKP